MKAISLIVILFITLSLKSQSFDLQVSSDSILFGNYIEVKFELDNIEGSFQAPDFSDFIVLSGPNLSSSIQIINNEMTSQKSYSYLIEPRQLGTMYIKPAFIIAKSDTLGTIPMEINVYPNPEGIIDSPKNFQDDLFNPLGGDFFIRKKDPKKSKKPSRKLKKI